jgi:hypothetical protein
MPHARASDDRSKASHLGRHPDASAEGIRNASVKSAGVE